MFLKNIFRLIILFMVLSPIMFAQQAAAYVEGEIIFQVATPFETIQTENGIVSTNQVWFNNLAQQYQIKELKPVFNSSQWKFRKFYQAVFDTTYTVEEVVNAFENEPGVMFAEPNYIFETYGNPNDPLFYKQWGLRTIKADSAWNIESGNSNVIVGVVDTGTDLVHNNGNPHVDLLDNLWNENGMYGYNAIDTTELPDDDNGHGTHVGGIAGAVTNNNTGVAGTAGGGSSGDDGIRIMSVKAFDLTGHGNDADIAEALRWAIDPDDNPASNDGADIINMSFGGADALAAAIDSIIHHADSLGVVLIAAAGNAAVDLDISGNNVYPAEFEEVLAVAATDSNDNKSWFSNFGAEIEVCAPGGAGGPLHDPGDVYSTLPWEPGSHLNQVGILPQYDYLWGTSMASPMVAGVAALLKSYNNTLTAQEIRRLLTGTADPLEDQFHDKFARKLGAGRVNAYAALLAVQGSISQPNLVYFGREIDDSGGDGILNVGEQANLAVFLRNFWDYAGNVTGVISSLDANITIGADSAVFGNLDYGDIGSNASQPFELQVSQNAVPGEYPFRMRVRSGNYLKEFDFYLTVHNRLGSGFPVSLNETVLAEPKIADLDGDGEREMVVLTQSGKVFIVQGDGQVGSPVYTNAGELVSTPALGDLDGDGDLESIFTSKNGKVYAIHHTGADVAGFPVDLQNEFLASPALGDVDGDHDLEIVVCGNLFVGVNNVFCLESEGFVKWQTNTGSSIRRSPAIGDYDNNGKDDVFCQSDGQAKITILNGENGQVQAQTPIAGAFNPQSGLTIGHIDDNDLFYDLIFTSLYTMSEQEETKSFLINGSDLSETFSNFTNKPLTTPIMDIVNGNSSLEYVFHLMPPQTTAEKGLIELYDKEGQSLAWIYSDHPYFHFLAVDLNDDGQQEILAVSGYDLNIFDEQLNILNDFVVSNPSGEFSLPPVISDFNNDGMIDLTTVNNNGVIFVYEHPYPYKSNAHHWPEAQHDMFNSKRYDPPALSGLLPANTAIEWSGTVRVSGDVIVPATSTLNIAPGSKIIFQHRDDEKAGESPTLPELRVYGTLNANGTESNPIEFFSYSRWYGIVADGNSQVNLNYCWIDKAQRGVYIKPGSENPIPITHSFNHCEISRGQYGIYSSYKKLDVTECRIHQQTFAGIYCAAGEANIQNSEISHNSSGVYLSESTFAISGNNIFDNGDYGIDLSNCAKGSITANLLQDNSANAGQPEHPPLAAIRLFNSAAKIYGNQVLYNQENGLLLLRESFPVVQETNLLLGNGPTDGEEEPVLEKAEILMQGDSAPYMGGGHNDIVDERPYAGYLMIHTGEVHGLIDVTSNYWGGEGPAERLYPLEYYDYEPWDPLPNSGGGLPKTPGKGSASGSFAKIAEDSSAQLFAQALSVEDQEDYLAAKTLYLQILSAYPDSMETLYSLPRLLACELALNGDFAALQNFYTAFSQNIGDTLRSKIAANLARRCQVRQELFNEAIVGYEAIVQQPPSLADSVYAVIDVGEIYLLQEELGNAPGASKTKGGGKSAVPAMGELKPLSREQFERTKAELLALLHLKGKKEGAEAIPQVFSLHQNYPNPFNPVTTIKYDLPKPAKVKLEIFNVLGQRVKTLVNESQAAAYYRLEWNGVNDRGSRVASGLYVYRLSAEALDGSEKYVNVKKMILIR